MNILNKLKSNGALFGLSLACAMSFARTATAEVTLLEKDDWTFSFDGRVNSFLSAGKGDDFPLPSPGGMHQVMGSNSSAGQGIPDVGWPSSVQRDPNNKYFAVRVRSGMFGNVLGFALTKKFGEQSSVRGYVSIWSTVETLGRDKWSPVTAEAREGYFTATGPWGSATIGKSLGWLGRTSYEIDVAYGHGYALGLPCTDGLGPACGHIGTGALFPGYSAGMSYSTPSLGGLQLHAGIYDPVVFASTEQDWSHASTVRPEGSLTFKKAIGDKFKFKVGVEGLYQPIGRIRTVTDPTTMAETKSTETTSIWGVSGGVRVEIGPVRLGGSAFRGRGIGLGTAVQRSAATADNDVAGPNGLSYKLRTFTGFYGQGALVLGNWQLGAGYGLGTVDQLDADKANPNLSVIRYQAGISGTLYYFLSDSVVLGFDYFHYIAGWYGAPIADPTTMQATGQKLAGERQILDFVNAGVTYRW